MKNQQQKSLKYFPNIIVSFFSLLLLSTAITRFSGKGLFFVADLAEFNQGIDLNSEFENSNDDSIFKSGPMEVLDAWRRATAMEDATSPSDALDEAIKAFEDNEFVNLSNDQ